MKAAVYDVEGAPGVLKYVDVPEPVTGPDDILISVEAISIEGGDLIIRRSTPPPLPLWIGGYAAAGTVVAAGSKVRSRTVGDRVAAFHMQGSHAERWAVPAERTWLIPDGVGMAEAAALPISFGTAHHCLFTRGMLRQGETVLIQAAAGGVGLAAVQLASQAGATVIAVVSGTQRRGRLRELGADYVVDRTKDNIVDSVRQYTHGTGVDLVIDPVGTTLPASLSALAPEGRLVFVGNAGGDSLTVDLWPAMQSNQTLMGVFMGPLFARQGVRTSVDEMLQAVAAGRVTVVIDRIFPLANAAAAHEFAETAKPLGRIVMKP
ncbi:quinone oxidoreductase family protein [Klebsiella michiganensis]|uniref:quinone oxidoreductase family protein n=1 Tax=Klebsiella michiganensis TaxID=1134687 RepID=UPI000A1CC017|nr:zinc-binding alcohol dehydrogenase family protein [Klebsiella michiganensis]AVE76636.1 NADP-dependent oxidoreductase [Klebsiella oxytoca]MBZ7331879.1 zinc-binding alcohol dehydrogenase family protein [Klebsiella michiganensis]MDM4569561.1 zinc-binding alcohol dehydrogenase family protein [Klebsiella michiganensis]MDM4585561.1 zinc-binding alcohol dehydrogenase family protein [Klebsiella michiganensis]